MSGTAAGGAAQITLNVDMVSAFNAALQAIEASGGSVQAHQPPSLIRFQTGKRSFWGSLWMRIRFDGDLTLSPIGPRQTAVRVALKLNSGSSTMLMAMDGVALLFLLVGAIIAKNFILFAFVAAIAGVQYWTISTRWSTDLAQVIVNSLLAAQSQAGLVAPPPIPVPSGPRVPPPVPVSAGSPSAPPAGSSQPSATPSVAQPTNVFEQLKQLGALRDAGIVTAEEFESKKADLLKRL